MVTELAGTPEGAVGARVRHLREKRGLKQIDLADLCHEVGYPLSKQRIHKIELGERRVNVNDLIALALALDISPLVLLMPHDADDDMNLTSTVTAPGAEIYAWFLGVRPAPTTSEADDTARAWAAMRHRQEIPYAATVSGVVRVDFGLGINEKHIAELVRDTEKGADDDER